MRILLAEDDRLINDAVKEILLRNHYSIDCVYDGEEAVYYASEVEYDLLILDIMMPKKNGLEVVKALRKDNVEVPILMLTAKSQIEDKVEGLDAGADDYLSKPFSMKELLARVRALTRRVKGIHENNLCFGDMVLNRKSFQLSSLRTKKAITLVGKEYQILEYLVMNKNQFVSANMLLDKIWGFDTDSGVDIIWVNISGLRKKIKSVELNVEIKVKRNAGYYLELK